MGGKIVAGLILSLLLASGARAQDCRDAKLSVANGMFLKTTDGQRYQAFPGQGWRTTVWMPLDRLRLCMLGGNAFTVTDLDRKGDTIKALYLN